MSAEAERGATQLLKLKIEQRARRHELRPLLFHSWTAPPAPRKQRAHQLGLPHACPHTRPCIGPGLLEELGGQRQLLTQQPQRCVGRSQLEKSLYR
jgi:hypothetical protein|eukprot:jgi/Chrpa1/26660/Chrysochromulina_OHIO_Genome00024330-RA